MAQNDRVGDAYIDIKPRAEGFAPGVQAIINRVERDAKFAVAANTGPAQQQIEQLSQQIKNQIGGSLAEAAVQAAGFTAAVFGVKTAVEGVISKFSELFDGIAKARAGFNSILGEKSGENLLSQVRQFAIDSPFVTSELVQYSQQLLGVGKAANTIVPTLKSVGDIVASVGGDTSNLGSILYALTQIQTIGKLTGQDARQLQNQLVPITKYIAEYTGKSVADVKKLQEAGGIASDVVFAAIENQGKKVEGALNNSVRTISGAKSVLSDTLKNFIQSSPAFNKIYDDLVKGIQNVAAAVSKPEVAGAINKALESIGKVYEALKPAIEAFGDLASSGGLSALGAFTQTLNILSDVLNAIPAPVLSAIATVLSAMAVLKAPLALIQYAQNIQRITTGLIGSGGAGLISSVTRANTVMTAQAVSVSAAGAAATGAASGYSALSAEMQATVVEGQRLAASLDAANAAAVRSAAIRAKLGSLATIGAAVAGGLLQSTSQGNVGAQTAGGALTYGAIGFQVAGPYGAAVGAAYGALTSFLDAQDAKLEAQVEKNRQLGKASAEAYLKENEKLFSTATGTSANKITNDLKVTEDAIAAIEKSRKDRQNESGGFVDDPLKVLGFLPGSSNEDNINADAKKKTALIEATLKEQKAIYDKLAQPIIDAVDKAKKEGVGNSFFTQNGGPLAGLGALTAQQRKSFDDLDVEFRKYGVTTADVAAMGSDAFVDLVTRIDALDTAQKKAVVSANVLADALKNAAGDSAAIYATQISNLGTQISQLNALDAAKKAGVATVTPGQTGSAIDLNRVQAQQTLLQAQQIARTNAYAASIVASDEAITAAKKAGNDVLAESIKNGKENQALSAAVAAEQQVVTDVYRAQTLTVSDNAKARERQNRATAEAKTLSDLQAAASSFGATTSATGAAVQAALRPQDRAAGYTAQVALIQAQTAAGTVAAAAASLTTRKAIDNLITAGLALDSTVIKSLQDQVYTEEQIAKTIAAEKVLQQVERDSALARSSYNAETVRFITNLQKAQQASSIIFGDELSRAQALAGFINTIDSGASAAAAVFTGTATLAEKASLEVSALSARQSQYNAALALGASATFAAASAQLAYDSIIQASNTNMLTLTASVEALNKANLGSAEGRSAIAGVATQQIQDVVANINAAESTLAALKQATDKQGRDAGPTATETAAAAEVFKQRHILDILTGKAKDDLGILNGISTAAQALIQPQLDSAAAAKAKEAEDAAKKAADELQRYQEAVVSATTSLTDKLQAAADNIANAAKQWVGSIKERTQYEQATSVGSLTRNAGRQARDLTEVTAGLANLRARGVSQAVLDSLGINNVSDTRQVRKLVNASDSDLGALTKAVSERDALANTLATNEEQKRTQKTITDAILDAATKLEFGATPAEAAALAATININGMSAEEATRAILGALSGGKIG